jgi:hypothetical protein
MTNFYRITALLTIGFLCVLPKQGNAQSLLDKYISVNVNSSRVADVLNEISSKGGFYFSYNSRLIPRDSLVTLTANNQQVSRILHQLFKERYDYNEQQNYVIITPVLSRLMLINTDLTNDNNTFSVSGMVVDEGTGERLMNASVYEKTHLVATLTDEHGYFKLKFRTSNPGSITVTASKRLYRDTTIHFLQTVLVSSRANTATYRNIDEESNRIERTGLGSLFISARQKIQSLNITDFFAKRPFQVSITPGLSTHGMFSPQVVNKFSLNLAGGYTAGVNGLEVAGLFNINKKSARYLQLAGVFNLVGGNVIGLQLAGAHNRALDTVKGVQISLFTNKAQAQLSGVQISALHNETHRLKGFQIGMVNVADTSQGVSIGLINIIYNGFYRISYTANNLANTNLALKTGTHNLYSTLLLGMNVSANNKFYAFGFGIGHDVMFSNNLYLSAEAAYQFSNAGTWDDGWWQAKLLLNVQLSKHISLVAGPTFNRYNHSGAWRSPGYKNVTDLPEYPAYSASFYQAKRWIGWEAGIAFNSVFKPAKRAIDNSQAWYLGFAATGGAPWDEPFGLVSGGELFVHRDLGEYLTGTLSTGYTYFSADRNRLLFGNGQNNVYAQPVKVIPVKAGIRLMTGKHFFIAGEIGEAFGNTLPYIVHNANPFTYTPVYKPYRSLMYAASMGFSFTSGLEAGIKFEDYGLQTAYKQFALRLGYRFKISK